MTRPVLTRCAVATLPMAAGKYLVAAYLAPVPFDEVQVYQGCSIVTGIYLITDETGRICKLGRTSRDRELPARLAELDRDPDRTRFHAIRVLHLQDRTPRDALNAITGACADWLGLRTAMPARRWPSSDRWLQLVS